MTTRIQHAGGRADRLTPSAGAVSGVIGKLTAVHRERAERMAALAVSEGQQWHTREELQSAVLYTASAAVERIEEHGLSQLSVAWNSAGPPQIRTLQKPWYDVAESADACGIRVDDGGTGFVHGSVSGAQVLYVKRLMGRCSLRRVSIGSQAPQIMSRRTGNRGAKFWGSALHFRGGPLWRRYAGSCPCSMSMWLMGPRLCSNIGGHGKAVSHGSA